MNPYLRQRLIRINKVGYCTCIVCMEPNQVVSFRLRNLCISSIRSIYASVELNAPQNFDLRDMLRNTWASNISNNKTRRVFLVGRSELSMEQLVLNESKTFDDIFLYNMVDAYHNMTIKVSFKYVLCCPILPYTLLTAYTWLNKWIVFHLILQHIMLLFSNMGSVLQIFTKYIYYNHNYIYGYKVNNVTSTNVMDTWFLLLNHYLHVRATNSVET